MFLRERPVRHSTSDVHERPDRTRHHGPSAGPSALMAAPRQMEEHTPDVDVLQELRSGRRDSLDRLMPVVYEQLRVIASRQMTLRNGGGTLSTTGLIHEAYLKLVDQSRVGWRDRSHFFALASVAMRHVLVDRAKARLAQKREGGFRRVTLDDEHLDTLYLHQIRAGEAKD